MFAITAAVTSAVRNARVVSTAEFCGRSRTIRDRISASFPLLSLDFLFLFVALCVSLSFSFAASDPQSERRNGFAIRAEGTLRVPLAMPAKNNSCLFAVRISSAYDREAAVRERPSISFVAFPDRSLLYYINARCISYLWRLHLSVALA